LLQSLIDEFDFSEKTYATPAAPNIVLADDEEQEVLSKDEHEDYKNSSW